MRIQFFCFLSAPYSIFLSRNTFAPEQLICRDPKDLCQHRKQRDIRCTFIPLPSADRFIGHIDFFRQLFLRISIRLPQCCKKLPHRFLFHTLLLFPHPFSVAASFYNTVRKRNTGQTVIFSRIARIPASAHFFG